MNRRGFLTGALAATAAVSLPAAAAPMVMRTTVEVHEVYGLSPLAAALPQIAEFEAAMQEMRAAIRNAFIIPPHLLTPIEVCERETFLFVPAAPLSIRAGANSPMAACVDEYERDEEERRE